MRPAALVTASCRGPGLDLLRELCDVTYDPWIDQHPLRIWDGAKLAERVDELGATVLVCEADFVAGEVLERPLRVIGSTRGDPTNVDVAAATARGIPVLRTPGRNADGVAELTVALLFAVTPPPAARAITTCAPTPIFANGSIPYQRYRAWQISGRTAGLVGLGAVGRATRWRLEGLGMRVISYRPLLRARPPTTRWRRCWPRPTWCRCTPRRRPTRSGMMGAAQFAAMREGAYYVNSARGGLHDLDALVAALQSGHLAGAGLDHFDGEHLPEGHPLIAMTNVVLTPHIGGATYDTEVNHTAMIAEDIRRVLAGETPLHCVNPEVLP